VFPSEIHLSPVSVANKKKPFYTKSLTFLQGTSELRGYPFYFGGFNIMLVDSPGFNDTYKTETQVLKEIAEWLEDTYEKETKLSGIIYIHPIKNERMEGSAMRNLKMFRELCGTNPLRNVVLVTSFWDQVERAVGERREAELKETPDFWGAMIEKGSRISRFRGRDSALSIVLELASQTPLPLSIQQEMVEQGKPLIETAAGIVVNEELARLEASHRKEREDLQREYQEALKAHDQEMQEVLKRERQRMDDKLERLHRQQELLREQRRVQQRQWHEQFESLRSKVDLNRFPNSNGSQLSSPPSQFQNPIGPQDLDLDWIVSVVRANEAKITADERIIVELKILETKKKKNGPSKLQKIDKKKLGQFLLQSLRIALPVTTMALLGFPIHLPIFSSSSDSSSGQGTDESGT